MTKHGNLDVALLPDSTLGFDDLRRDATRERIADTLEVPVAALADLIRSKAAATRVGRQVAVVVTQLFAGSPLKVADWRSGPIE